MRNIVNSVWEKMKRQAGCCVDVRGGRAERREHAQVCKNICRFFDMKLNKFLLNNFHFPLEVETMKSLKMMGDPVG